MVSTILNNAHISPHRLHALVRLVARLPGLPQRDLFALLQPDALTGAASDSGQQANFRTLVNAAEQCGLIAVDPANERSVTLRVLAAEIEAVAVFRRHMQGRLFDATDATEQDALFGLFSAYYAAKDADALPDKVEQRFDSDVFPSAAEQRMNSTKLNGWRPWAAFLGLGWQTQQGSRQLLVSDATVRVRDALPRILPAPGPVPFAAFIGAVGEVCPELDGGVWFRQCRGTGYGNVISLMLSNALRALDREGAIRLRGVGDSGETWRCYPGDTYAPSFSHVERPEAR